MSDMTTRLILTMKGKNPMSIREIATSVIGSKQFNVRKCEERLKYHLQTLEADGIVQSFRSGNRNLYKLSEDVEVLNGKLILVDEDGKQKYEENVTNVLRVDLNGVAMISILQ